MQMSEIDEAADIRRDVNFNAGQLLAGVTAAQKYKFSLSCSDMDSPGFAAHGERPHRVPQGRQGDADHHSRTRRHRAADLYRHEHGLDVTRDEWGAITSWQLDLEEA
jgi:hypothetical protein